VSVAENTAASTAIYTAQAFDNDAADGGEHVTYSLIDADNGADAQYFTSTRQRVRSLSKPALTLKAPTRLHTPLSSPPLTRQAM
jgi:hypothetical protein